MVGVPTSNRCDNCRKRKKKCGEELPGCTACLRSGWICPGYGRRWKFIDETSSLRALYASRKFVYEEFDLSPTRPDLHAPRHAFEDSRLSHAKEETCHNTCQALEAQWTKTTLAIRAPGLLASDRLGFTLICILERPSNKVLLPLRSVGSFFDFIPTRLGLNAALDSAASCLSAIYTCAFPAPQEIPREILQRYTLALRYLQVHVNNAMLRMEPETLCASILLQLCELVVNVDKGEWSHLARGTAMLIESRGPERHRSTFERTMLESQQSFMIGPCIQLREHCFLSKPEWQRLLLSPAQSLPVSEPRSLRLRTSFRGEGDGKICRLNEWETQRAQLAHRAAALLNALQTWYTLELEPLFSPQTSPSRCPSVNSEAHQCVHYPDILSGVVDCVSNIALITLKEILRQLDHGLSETHISGALSPQSADIETRRVASRAETIEEWRRRVLLSFTYVRQESALAAKPLEFGVQQIGGLNFGIPNLFEHSFQKLTEE